MTSEAVAAVLSKYAAILADSPTDLDALYLYGAALLQLNRPADAIETFTRFVAARPTLSDGHNNLGVAYQAVGDWDRAAISYRTAIATQPQGPLAFFNLGRLLDGRGLPAEAETYLRQAVELRPNDSTYRLQLAGVLGRQEKWQEAETILRLATELDPANLDLHVNHGYSLLKLERLEEAVAVYRNVLAIHVDYAEVHNNLGFVLERMGRLDEAQAAVERALELRPLFAAGFNNLGTIFRSMHRLAEACKSFRQALEIEPDFALAEFNLGTTLLLAEDYREGWVGYRQCGRVGGAAAPHPVFPDWDGRPIIGKRLLLHAEQGFGDAIQFARFVPLAKARSGATITLVCRPPLLRLFSKLAGGDQVLIEGDPGPAFDYRLALSALPGLFGIDLEGVGIGVPYLSPPSELRSDLHEMFGEDSMPGFRVGLVWQGNRRQTRDAMRSCPLECLAPLFHTEGAIFYSLTTEPSGREQLASLTDSDRFTDLGNMLNDFSDTAAIISKLDLLITVDTASAHLAGAMGRPVWTMLCHTPDWRWHLDRSDSPWYPTMRLFRQSRWGDWDSVVTEVRSALEASIASRAG